MLEVFIEVFIMELVVDANIVFSILLKSEGKTADLLFCDNFVLFTPEFILDEIKKYEEEIIKRAEITKNEFNVFLNIIFSRIRIILKNEFEQLLNEAGRLCPDKKDLTYLALALHLNCSVWSNDKVLKNQNKVKVYSTDDLVKLIKR